MDTTEEEDVAMKVPVESVHQLVQPFQNPEFAICDGASMPQALPAPEPGFSGSGNNAGPQLPSAVSWGPAHMLQGPAQFPLGAAPFFAYQPPMSGAYLAAAQSIFQGFAHSVAQPGSLHTPRHSGAPRARSNATGAQAHDPQGSSISSNQRRAIPLTSRRSSEERYCDDSTSSSDSEGGRSDASRSISSASSSRRSSSNSTGNHAGMSSASSRSVVVAGPVSTSYDRKVDELVARFGAEDGDAPPPQEGDGEDADADEDERGGRLALTRAGVFHQQPVATPTRSQMPGAGASAVIDSRGASLIGLALPGSIGSPMNPHVLLPRRSSAGAGAQPTPISASTASVPAPSLSPSAAAAFPNFSSPSLPASRSSMYWSPGSGLAVVPSETTGGSFPGTMPGSIPAAPYGWPDAAGYALQAQLMASFWHPMYGAAGSMDPAAFQAYSNAMNMWRSAVDVSSQSSSGPTSAGQSGPPVLPSAGVDACAGPGALLGAGTMQPSLPMSGGYPAFYPPVAFGFPGSVDAMAMSGAGVGMMSPLPYTSGFPHMPGMLQVGQPQGQHVPQNSGSRSSKKGRHRHRSRSSLRSHTDSGDSSRENFSSHSEGSSECESRHRSSSRSSRKYRRHDLSHGAHDVRSGRSPSSGGKASDEHEKHRLQSSSTGSPSSRRRLDDLKLDALSTSRSPRPNSFIWSAQAHSTGRVIERIHNGRSNSIGLGDLRLLRPALKRSSVVEQKSVPDRGRSLSKLRWAEDVRSSDGPGISDIPSLSTDRSRSADSRPLPNKEISRGYGGAVSSSLPRSASLDPSVGHAGPRAVGSSLSGLSTLRSLQAVRPLGMNRSAAKAGPSGADRPGPPGRSIIAEGAIAMAPIRGVTSASSGPALNVTDSPIPTSNSTVAPSQLSNLFSKFLAQANGGGKSALLPAGFVGSDIVRGRSAERTALSPSPRRSQSAPRVLGLSSPGSPGRSSSSQPGGQSSAAPDRPAVKRSKSVAPVRSASPMRLASPRPERPEGQSGQELQHAHSSSTAAILSILSQRTFSPQHGGHANVSNSVSSSSALAGGGSSGSPSKVKQAWSFLSAGQVADMPNAIPKSSLLNLGGATRSGRVSIPPLEHWRGARLVSSEGFETVVSLTGTLAGMAAQSSHTDAGSSGVSAETARVLKKGRVASKSDAVSEKKAKGMPKALKQKRMAQARKKAENEPIVDTAAPSSKRHLHAKVDPAEAPASSDAIRRAARRLNSKGRRDSAGPSSDLEPVVSILAAAGGDALQHSENAPPDDAEPLLAKKERGKKKAQPSLVSITEEVVLTSLATAVPRKRKRDAIAGDSEIPALFVELNVAPPRETSVVGKVKRGAKPKGVSNAILLGKAGGSRGGASAPAAPSSPDVWDVSVAARVPSVRAAVPRARTGKSYASSHGHSTTPAMDGWSPHDEALLGAAHTRVPMKGGIVNWLAIAQLVPSKSAEQCKAKWIAGLDFVGSPSPWKGARKRKRVGADDGDEAGSISSHGTVDSMDDENNVVARIDALKGRPEAMAAALGRVGTKRRKEVEKRLAHALATGELGSSSQSNAALPDVFGLHQNNISSATFSASASTPVPLIATAAVVSSSRSSLKRAHKLPARLSGSELVFPTGIGGFSASSIAAPDRRGSLIEADDGNFSFSLAGQAALSLDFSYGLDDSLAGVAATTAPSPSHGRKLSPSAVANARGVRKGKQVGFFSHASDAVSGVFDVHVDAGRSVQGNERYRKPKNSRVAVCATAIVPADEFSRVNGVLTRGRAVTFTAATSPTGEIRMRSRAGPEDSDNDDQYDGGSDEQSEDS